MTAIAFALCFFVFALPLLVLVTEVQKQFTAAPPPRRVNLKARTWAEQQEAEARAWRWKMVQWAVALWAVLVSLGLRVFL
jgi:hypothetical protein